MKIHSSYTQLLHGIMRKKNNEESCMHRRLPLSMPTDTQKYVDHKLHEDKEAIFIEH